MKYKGYIFGSITPLKALGVDPKEPHTFCLIGFGSDYENRKVGRYRMIMENGEIVKGLEKMLFSRTRENEFYLESIG